MTHTKTHRTLPALRPFLVLVHRWAGLGMAVFLFIAGLTGAIISWDHELDEWLNPQLFVARSGSAAPLADPLALARRLEAADPRLAVSFLPLHFEAGHTLNVGVYAHVDPASDLPHALGFNQMAIDPANGEVQGRREWGAISLAPENLLPFLYKLHYSMHLPDIGNLYFGMLVMGVIAVVWVVDCLAALWLSFPSAAAWRKSFAFRWRQGGYRLNFDLHRSGAVWTWTLLLILSTSSVAMNLGPEVMRPLVRLFSPLTPSAYVDLRQANPPQQPIEPRLQREEILALAQSTAGVRGWSDPAGSIGYSEAYGIYAVTFHPPGEDHPNGGLGHPSLMFDGQTGELLEVKVPGAGSAGDIFLHAQFPLHSGRILGLPGRILISLMGLAVAVLCVTGVVIWLRKRQARQRQAARDSQ